MTDLRRLPSAYPGTCRSCLRKREVFSVSRSGGGTYRRGGRSYSSSICGECAVDALPYCGTHAMATHHGFSVRTLLEIAVAVGTEEARAAVDAYVARMEVRLSVYNASRRDSWNAYKASLGL